MESGARANDIDDGKVFYSAVSEAGILHLDRQEQIEQALLSVSVSNFFNQKEQEILLTNRPVELAPGVLLPRLSQIARVLSLFPVRKGTRVLEIGCGNGYTSALLQSMGAQVYALESQGLVGQRARKCLDRTKYQSVMVKGGSQTLRWKEYAPFDVVVSWRYFTELPYAISEDVIEGGKIVAPIGDGDRITLYTWQLDSDIKVYQLEEFFCGPYLVS